MTDKDATSKLDQLLGSELRYRRLFEAAQDGILIVDDRSGQVLDANPFIAELLGYSAAELRGKMLWELGLFVDVAAIKTVFATLQGTGYARHDDLPLVSKDGRHVDVEFVSNRYVEDGGSVIQCNIRDISQRKQQWAQLRHAADTDELTGLASRRRVLEFAASELQRAQRYRRTLSLLLLDIDHFKHVNDAYGHAAGDQALRGFADACRSVFREADMVGRLGGEEFLAVLPETSQVAAVQVAQRLREAVAASPVLPQQDDGLRITVSGGVATTVYGLGTLEDLLVRADRQLYAAKQGGRDRIHAEAQSSASAA